MFFIHSTASESRWSIPFLIHHIFTYTKSWCQEVKPVCLHQSWVLWPIPCPTYYSVMFNWAHCLSHEKEDSQNRKDWSRFSPMTDSDSRVWSVWPVHVLSYVIVRWGCEVLDMSIFHVIMRWGVMCWMSTYSKLRHHEVGFEVLDVHMF